jgi:hypothetical protein
LLHSVKFSVKPKKDAAKVIVSFETTKEKPKKNINLSPPTPVYKGIA